MLKVLQLGSSFLLRAALVISSFGVLFALPSLAHAQSAPVSEPASAVNRAAIPKNYMVRDFFANPSLVQ